MRHNVIPRNGNWNEMNSWSCPEGCVVMYSNPITALTHNCVFCYCCHNVPCVIMCQLRNFFWEYLWNWIKSCGHSQHLRRVVWHITCGGWRLDTIGKLSVLEKLVPTKKTMLVFWYRALATQIRCLWPPLRLIPCRITTHKHKLNTFDSDDIV